MAIRDHPIAAETMGVNTSFFKAMCFGVSALYAGVAGALAVTIVGFVSPDSFGLFLSLSFLVGVVVGGLASIWGVVFGALFIEFVPNYADQLSDLFGESAKALPGAIYGVLLIALMYVMPTGVAGAIGAAPRLYRRLFRERSATKVEQKQAAAAATMIASIKKTGASAPPQEEEPMISRRTLLQAGAVSAAALASGSRAAFAADMPGITDTEIKIGQTMPYSGPASAYGVIGKTEAAYFKMINEQGGVNGRKINLISLDDGYSPPKTVEQVRRLVEQDQVAFLFQTLGTPSNAAIRPYLNENKVPQLFVSTGASMWADPEHFPWTIGFNPNYQTEAKIYGINILKTSPDAKIGVLYQNDGFGKDYLIGLKAGLGDDTPRSSSKRSPTKSPNRRSIRRSSRSRIPAPTLSSSRRRRNSRRRRSARAMTSAGRRRAISATFRLPSPPC